MIALSIPMERRHLFHVVVAKLRKSLFDANADSGQALIEMAITITALATVLFGIMSIGIAVYSYFLVSYSAREATRYAMVRGNTFTTDCSSPGYANCIAQNGDIQTYVRDLGFPAITIRNLTTTSTWITSLGSSCGTADTCKTPGNFVHVTVSYSLPLAIPFMPSRTLSLASSAQMVMAQ